MRGERLWWILLTLGVGVATYWGTFVTHRPERYYFTMHVESDAGCPISAKIERAQIPFGWEQDGEWMLTFTCEDYLYYKNKILIGCECHNWGQPDGGVGR